MSWRLEHVADRQQQIEMHGRALRSKPGSGLDKPRSADPGKVGS